MATSKVLKHSCYIWFTKLAESSYVQIFIHLSWSLTLQIGMMEKIEYYPFPWHIVVKDNVVADALSRMCLWIPGSKCNQPRGTALCSWQLHTATYTDGHSFRPKAKDGRLGQTANVSSKVWVLRHIPLLWHLMFLHPIVTILYLIWCTWYDVPDMMYLIWCTWYAVPDMSCCEYWCKVILYCKAKILQHIGFSFL